MDHEADLEELNIIQLLCLNQDEVMPWDCGLWNETELPPALRDSLRQPQRYLQAIQDINSFQRQGWQQRLIDYMILTISIHIYVFMFIWYGYGLSSEKTVFYGIAWFVLYVCWENPPLLYLKKEVARANLMLCEEDTLIGCVAKAELLVVHVPLNACRGQLADRYDFMLQKHSCAYACYLAQRHADSAPPPEERGHLRGGPCFCQYVLKKERSWCRHFS